MNHTAGRHSTDLSSAALEIERSNDFQRFNASHSSDITIDFSSEIDEFSDLEDSCSSDEENDRIYADYRQMLTLGNRTTKKKRHEAEKKSVSCPARNRFRRTERKVTSTTTDEDIKPPQHVPKSDETIVTQQTTSVTSLGTAEFQWFASGGERIKGKTRRANIISASKNRENIDAVSRFFRRGGQKLFA